MTRFGVSPFLLQSVRDSGKYTDNDTIQEMKIEEIISVLCVRRHRLVDPWRNNQ